jgi:two-component system, OmpR family, sensor histidine kinase CiaH
MILIDNALKYSNGYGNIDIELKGKDKSVEIVVSDTGDGIKKEEIKKIFNRFYRVDTARTSDRGGSGLGLAIAKCIVAEHHGLITVESTPGYGTKFIILLPNKHHNM